MTVALDVGSYRMKSLRLEKDRLVVRRGRSLYAILPATVSQRKLLERAGIPFASCDGQLLLMGDAAAELSELFQTPAAPLLPKGHLPSGSPAGRQVLAAMIESLVPRSNKPGEPCGLILPCGREHGEHLEAEFLTRVVKLQGYRPIVVPAGTALVLSELVGEQFTGLGIVCGASQTHVSLTHLGQTAAEGTLRMGGDVLDLRLAERTNAQAFDHDGQRYWDTHRIAQQRENDYGSVLAPATDFECQLADECERYCDAILHLLTAKLDRNVRLHELPKSVVAVCGGGLSRLPGFVEMLGRKLQAAAFPIGISQVRQAEPADETLVRGALIRTMLEADCGMMANAA